MTSSSSAVGSFGAPSSLQTEVKSSPPSSISSAALAAALQKADAQKGKAKINDSVSRTLPLLRAANAKEEAALRLQPYSARPPLSRWSSLEMVDLQRKVQYLQEELLPASFNAEACRLIAEYVGEEGAQTPLVPFPANTPIPVNLMATLFKDPPQRQILDSLVEGWSELIRTQKLSLIEILGLDIYMRLYLLFLSGPTEALFTQALSDFAHAFAHFHTIFWHRRAVRDNPGFLSKEYDPKHLKSLEPSRYERLLQIKKAKLEKLVSLQQLSPAILKNWSENQERALLSSKIGFLKGLLERSDAEDLLLLKLEAVLVGQEDQGRAFMALKQLALFFHELLQPPLSLNKDEREMYLRGKLALFQLWQFSPEKSADSAKHGLCSDLRLFVNVLSALTAAKDESIQQMCSSSQMGRQTECEASTNLLFFERNRQLLYVHYAQLLQDLYERYLCPYLSQSFFERFVMNLSVLTGLTDEVRAVQGDFFKQLITREAWKAMARLEKRVRQCSKEGAVSYASMLPFISLWAIPLVKKLATRLPHLTQVKKPNLNRLKFHEKLSGKSLQELLEGSVQIKDQLQTEWIQSQEPLVRLIMLIKDAEQLTCPPSEKEDEDLHLMPQELALYLHIGDEVQALIDTLIAEKKLVAPQPAPVPVPEPSKPVPKAPPAVSKKIEKEEDRKEREKEAEALQLNLYDKRRVVLSKLRELGFLEQPGGRHPQVRHPKSGQRIPVPHRMTPGVIQSIQHLANAKR